MKAAGKREKGSRLERQVAGLIRSKFNVAATRMPMSGAFTHLKGDIFMPEYSKFPFMIECKNQEKVQLWQFWNQARDQATPGNREPVLVVSGNHRPILAIMEIDTLLNLQKTVNDLEETIKTLKSD